ncbi:MAG: IclR family transcriptional regulator [Lachnospiraceae bacterium]|nr:IclR family transcriptional regulator [Lachnospiraceae bacterium]
MKTNRTVQRAVQILSCIAAHPEGVSLDELCEQFSLPKTSAYDILVTLVQEGMLSTKSGPKQLYQIGIFAYRIGMSYPDADDTLKLIASELTELAHISDRTAFFGKLSGKEVVYILKEVPENPIITTATVGSTAPLYCTSLGKTLLAFLPEEQSNALLSDMEIQPRTRYTLKSPEELSRDLDLIRTRGYALDFREYEEHMVCASAPVYQRNGTLEGAVSISGFYRPEDDYEKAGELIRRQAARISRLLGYQGTV